MGGGEVPFRWHDDIALYLPTNLVLGQWSAPRYRGSAHEDLNLQCCISHSYG